jgi:hypothetical protein
MSNQESSAPENGAPPQIQRLYSMIGEWDVQFESRASPEESFVLHQITSHIIPILGGAFIQEQLSIPTSSGEYVNLIGILGYDRYREIYRFAWLDDKYAIFDIHEGNWDGEALVVDNLRSATTFRFGDLDFFSRMTWREITNEGFMIESDLSTDGGKTWFTQAKGRYLRRVK